MPVEITKSGPEGGPRMIYVGIDLHRKRLQIAALADRYAEWMIENWKPQG
jgi:hypothetical protein